MCFTTTAPEILKKHQQNQDLKQIVPDEDCICPDCGDEIVFGSPTSTTAVLSSNFISPAYRRGNQEHHDSNFRLGKAPVSQKVRGRALDLLRPNLPFEQRFSLDPNVLGEGMFGVVRTGMDLLTGQRIAIKEVYMRKLYSAEEKMCTLREPLVLKYLNHPNILRYVSHNITDEKCVVVTELLEGQSLTDYCQRIDRRRGIPEEEAKRVIHDILLALAYLHDECGIAHTDVKLDNILLTSDQIQPAAHGTQAKLIDFGTCCQIATMANGVEIAVKRQDVVGTHGYMAPEILLRQPYTTKVDMWSLGIVAFFLLSAYHPFMPYSDCLKFGADFSDRSWQNVSPMAKEFVQKLLEVNPDKRLSASEALSHAWFS